ncbi:MAG TPA: biotin synthase BioB [Desulfobulbus sp.]|nr:biotin synthase BioB [Desulfobulbus sp.]
MTSLITTSLDKVLAGRRLDRDTALALAAWPEPEELWRSADAIRIHFQGKRFHLCSIINARSGNCTEDCRFCAQSARYRTNSPVYDLIDTDQALTIALDNDRYGVHRLSLVTSGHSVDGPTLDRLQELYGSIRARTGMQSCASMGFLTPEKATLLREMGVSRYHCNLETSRDFFPRICTSHTWEDKIETLRHARAAGMSLCSGGIIGMGESMAERIDLALELRELGVDSIPINILTPIPGTPLADLPLLSLTEVLTTIALFRFLNPEIVIRIAGGRQQLGGDQYRCFTAGANGAIVGNYLTTAGASIDEDLAALARLGYHFRAGEPALS